jgi:hypothetical protein
MHATCVLFGIVPARPAILYSAAEPLARKPYQSQLEVDRAGGERLGVEQCRRSVGGQVAGNEDPIRAKDPTPKALSVCEDASACRRVLQGRALQKTWLAVQCEKDRSQCRPTG